MALRIGIVQMGLVAPLHAACMTLTERRGRVGLSTAVAVVPEAIIRIAITKGVVRPAAM